MKENEDNKCEVSEGFLGFCLHTKIFDDLCEGLPLLL